MKRKERDGKVEERLCITSRGKDLKMFTVTRLPQRVETISAILRDGNEKDETSPSKFEPLPHDLMMAVVSRLGAKSLMKFRCVSKMWSSIIRSKGFIDSFFSMSSTQSRFILALSNGLYSEPDEQLTFFLSFTESSSSSCLLPSLEMTLPNRLNSLIETFASIHGFLTVATDSGLMVCNPSTEQVIKLPMFTRFVGYDPIDGQRKALSVEWRDGLDGNLKHKVLTFGGSSQGWRHIEGNPGPYHVTSVGVCVNGFIYYGARNNSPGFRNPVVVCFDVRSEKLSFIQAPEGVVHWGKDSIFIDYHGKLASIVRFPYDRFHSFDLWILEDAEKHEWSKQQFVFPSSVWDSVAGLHMSFPGTNKAGEIIMAPKMLSRKVGRFYIFYYNVQTNTIRRVRLQGIGDNREFRRSYGFFHKGICFVRIATQHIDSIASLTI